MIDLIFTKIVMLYREVQEQVCGVFLDKLRPRLLRASSMDILCSIIDAIMVAAARCEELGETAAVPARVCQQLLGDAQERLIFRAQQFIHDRIGGRVSQSDLNYPAILTQDANARFSPVEDAVTIMNTTAQRLAAGVFAGIAHEAVTLAARSLNDAARIVTRTSGALDGQLFAVRQLQRLRDATAKYGTIGSTEVSLDFSGLREALGELARGHALFSLTRSHPLLALARGPRVMASRIDARAELEHNTRLARDTAAAHATRILLDPALTLLNEDAGALANTSMFSLVYFMRNSLF